MRDTFSIITFCFLNFFVSGQTSYDTIPFSDISFEIIGDTDLTNYEITDSLKNPFGYIVKKENKDVFQVITKEKSNYKIFDIPNGRINGGREIKIDRQNLIPGGYDELIVKFIYQNGKSFDSNGYSEATKGIEIFDLTNNKIIFSVDYYEGSEEWYSDQDTSYTNQNCDYCKDISIEKNEINLVPSKNATDKELENEVYIIKEYGIIKKITIANNGYK